MQSIKFLRRCCYFLLVLDVCLGIAHLLWPEFAWGQDRDSYFNFHNSLTLASWLAGMQFVCISVFAIVAFFRDRESACPGITAGVWIWLAGATVSLAISFFEITRIHYRFKMLGFPSPDVYGRIVVLSAGACLLVLFGLFVYNRLKLSAGSGSLAVAWPVLLGLSLGASAFENTASQGMQIWISFFAGIAFLAGCTLLLMSVGACVLRTCEVPPASTDGADENSFSSRSSKIKLLLGVSGMSFIIIFLEILLFQLLTVFNGYLTSNSIISVALLGGAVGGLIGYFTAYRKPFRAIIVSAVLLPVTILLCLCAVPAIRHAPLAASVLLMAPFVCASTIITIVLVRMDSGMGYFVILLGAGIGALTVSMTFVFREESSLLFLAAFALLAAGCFVSAKEPGVRPRALWMCLIVLGAVALTGMGILNIRHDWLNVVRTKVRRSSPEAEVLFSRSSFVGRYDIIRTSKEQQSLGTYENGRRIDTLRKYPAENHQIDPRIPHTYMKNPSILILGLSGDAITKTARYLSSEVYGVEINPVITDMQTHELIPYNANSYEGIDWQVMDARGYVKQSDRQYDIITLLNTHFARGGTEECASSPEYLFTYEALNEYLDHLTARGIILVEEPVTEDPAGEAPVWKFLHTMRQALLDRGVAEPQRHFFVFQWKTATNNYIQILMKKTPLTDEDTANLLRWTDDVSDILDIEEKAGKRLGPIRATTTILHRPGKDFSTNISKIVKGGTGDDFLSAHNIQPITDNKPFLFDINPARPGLKKAYANTFIMILFVMPFIGWLFLRKGAGLSGLGTHLLVVGFTGMGYMLIEIVLIQRYEIFIGSPVATFACVVGTMLISSGFGTLWSRNIGRKGAYTSMGIVIAAIIFQQYAAPFVFSSAVDFSLMVKAIIAVILIMPLGFAMGVPFPFMMRLGKADISESSVAVLYAFNAVLSALSVPLAFNISTALGIRITFFAGLLVYAAVWLLTVSVYKPALKKTAVLSAAALMCLLVVFPWLNTSASVPQSGNSVYSISYGNSKYPRDKVFYGGSNKEYVKLEWMFWLVRTPDRNILVDTGFTDPETAKEEGIRNFIVPMERLRQMGISPLDVSDVIITHTHWDHIGALSEYPKAKIWIQRKEYDNVLERRKAGRKSVTLEYCEQIFAAEKEGRLNIVDGNAVPAQGVSMTLAGGHTAGSQYVTVDTLDGPIILASDNIAVYDNSFFHIPVGSAYSRKESRAAISRMQAEGATTYLTIPGHDPDVMELFPVISEGIVRITVMPCRY